MAGNIKRLFIQVGLDIGRALNPLNILRNGFNLLRSTLVATFRTSVIGGFFAAMRAGFQVIDNIQKSVVQVVGAMAELNLAAIRTASVISEGGAGFDAAFTQASNSARELSTQVNFTAGQIQEGLFTAAQAGLDLNQALNFTQSALMLAATSGEDFKTIMNDMIGLSRGFGIGFENIASMADVITGAAQKSKVSVEGLFAGLKNVASVANVTFGESTETFLDMTAALMTLNDAGIENSTAGVKMRAALQQLNSGTAKTTAAFAKYGINVFKADGANQKYLDTLVKSQKASSGFEDELNGLKNRQLELVIAGQQGSQEFEDVENKINAVTGTLHTLDKGMGDVEEQFKLAGGQLKPFNELLDELQKAPKEVLQRAFGIKGGEVIARILQNKGNFDENKKEVKSFYDESIKGAGILTNVYNQFLSSILVKWQIMTNDVLGMFSVIADAAFGAFAPLLDPIMTGLSVLFANIQSHQGVFKKMFMGIAELLSPISKKIGEVLGQVGASLAAIFTEGVSLQLPVEVYNPDKNAYETVQKRTESNATVGEKLALAARSLISIFSSALHATFKALDPIIRELGKPFAEGLAAFLLAKTEIFIKMGAFVAEGFTRVFQMFMARFFIEMAQKGLLGPVAFIAAQIEKDKSRTSPTQIEDYVSSGYKPDTLGNLINRGAALNTTSPTQAALNTTSPTQAALNTTSPTQAALNTTSPTQAAVSSMMGAGNPQVKINGITSDLDTATSQNLTDVSKLISANLLNTGDKLVESINIILAASEKLNVKATGIQRSQALKDLRGI
jgi:TP901 family phage tail tape measure protein